MFNFKRIKLDSLGVVDDPRPPAEKERDYKHEELAMAMPFDWKEKPETAWRKYPVFNQDGSSSCVFQAIAKALGIENYLEEGLFVALSRRDGYSRRANRPQKGTYFADGMDIGHKGLTIEQLMPSQNMNEAQMNNDSDRTVACELVAKILRGGNYIALPINIDAIANIVEPTGKPVVLGVRFTDKEWFGKKVPEVLGSETKYGHGICITNATLYNGKKALVIEDSAYYDASKEAVRVVDESWFEAGRIMFAGYFTDLKNNGTDEKPHYQFNKDLQYGLKNDNDVKKLQECLAYLKFFPSRVDFTGNFYGITLKAVKDFQLAYNIEPVQGYVGKLTRAKLNELFI